MEVEKEIIAIRDRNRRVELDKTWETSWVRRATIAVFTYVVASIWLLIIENSHPFLNAFVPTGGYVLSTLTLPILKKVWLKSKIK